MNKLTEKQEYCLLVLYDYIQKHGKAPSRRELMELLAQKSANGVNQKLRALEKKGYIRLEPQKKRNIVILQKPLRQIDLFN